MPLPESQRLAYLKALGIDTYFPRMQLPGAPASGIVDVTAGSAVPVETGQSTADAPAAAPQAPVTRSVPRAPSAAQAESAPAQPGPASPAPESFVEARSKSPSKSPPKAPPKEEIRLQLLCIRASGDLAVLNAMPHMGPGRLSAGHRALLFNLLAACGVDGADIQVEDKAFCWPMVTGLHVDNSRRAAAAALTAYLQQKRADWGFSNLLVLGEEVVKRLYTPDESDDAGGPSLDSGNWRPVYTRSLDEMLQRPALKKEAWVQLRTLLA